MLELGSSRRLILVGGKRDGDRGARSSVSPPHGAWYWGRIAAAQRVSGRARRTRRRTEYATSFVEVTININRIKNLRFNIYAVRGLRPSLRARRYTVETVLERTRYGNPEKASAMPQTLPLPPRSEYRGPERRLSAAGRGPRPALAPCEASTVLRGVRGGRRQTPVTADAPSCPSPLGVLSTTSTIASSPLQLCTVDGRSAGTACAEILTSWPTRRPFRRELGVRGVPRRLRMSRLEGPVSNCMLIAFDCFPHQV